MKAGLWFGLWCFLAVVFGCGARWLGRRHRGFDQAKELIDYNADESSHDDGTPSEVAL